MEDQESEDLLKDIFPVGEERWIKFKYLDFKKCLRAFRLGQHNENGKKHAEEKGYEVVAIGCRDEYVPQVSALMDVRDEVINVLSILEHDGSGYSHLLDSVRASFKTKIDEVTSRTIKDVPIEK